MKKPRPPKQILGWRELVELPDLGLEGLKAKLDTGARTSALHAHHIEVIERDGARWVRCRLSTHSGRIRDEVRVELPVVEMRQVRSSSGHAELRPVIRTRLTLGGRTRLAELTITDRADMRYPMLVGRTALKAGRFLVDSSTSFKGSASTGPSA